MKKIFVKDIGEKDSVRDTFLITKKELAISKTGKAYLNIRLMDSSGEVEGRVWDNAEAIDKTFEKDNVVEVKGHGNSFREQIQLNVSSIKVLKEDEYDLRDYLPSSEIDPKVMMAELDSHIEGMSDRYIRLLITALLADEATRKKFMTAPAAMTMHHGFLGGLLEHVLSLTVLAKKVCSHYHDVNEDLLIAGVILHDFGKIHELSFDRSFGYTDEGKLIGHITIGIDLISKEAAKIDGFPDDLLMHLKHLILSHHGKLEFGSPKRPKTLEALVLSFIDDMDAKINAFQSLRDESGGDWSGYSRIFERYMYKVPYGGDEMTGEDAEAERGGRMVKEFADDLIPLSSYEGSPELHDDSPEPDEGRVTEGRAGGGAKKKLPAKEREESDKGESGAGQEDLKLF